ncbi:LysR family transcriptional regulator [Paraburkholderia aromaticivorans]|uniref:LysR family transcriptional regulator n=1 Tax=Paraburkholderia aromaticivorans TaxID=2026199 RepID=UPI001455EAAF|nr:LysR family transcriptional regulator [Paraburkholderia aromaticivorans]
MKTTQLRMLVAIAEHGTLMAAAEALNLSQPAVTKSVKELETRLGVQLLVRSGAGVRLTQYGEALLQRARRVVTEIARAEQELKDMKSSSERTLSIGVSMLAASVAVPDAIEAFRHRFPDSRFSVYECQPRQIIDGLRDGTFDLCVAAIALRDVTAEFQVDPIAVRSQSLAVRNGDPFGAETRLDALTHGHWLYNHTRESWPEFWSQLCGKRTIQEPARVSVCTSHKLYPKLAGESGAVSVWPDFLLDEHLRSGLLTRLATDAQLPELTVSLMYRKDHVFSATAEYFAECVASSKGSGV